MELYGLLTLNQAGPDIHIMVLQTRVGKGCTSTEGRQSNVFEIIRFTTDPIKRQTRLRLIRTTEVIIMERGTTKPINRSYLRRLRTSERRFTRPRVYPVHKISISVIIDYYHYHLRKIRDRVSTGSLLCPNLKRTTEYVPKKKLFCVQFLCLKYPTFWTDIPSRQKRISHLRRLG